ncbi:FecR domain-containing protein [Pseudomonas helleri]|uniref:FecR domain-containing protein n=1 Tax=Pseudomonas helleri TaxID=1608996 RepID=UPI00065286FF|nr:FecR family protein [Pseudomonas helleri]KMN05697.1 sensor protein [Pseudomonas helleri]
MNIENQHDDVIDNATRWIVLLRSGHASEADWQAYRQWRAQDPRHEQLCAQLETRLGVFKVPINQGVSGKVLQQALTTPGTSRRKLLQGALACTGVALGASLLVSQRTALGELTADVSTGTAERRTVSLPDGSELFLNAKSAVDLDFSGPHRIVRLLDGELRVKVAVNPATPFQLVTPQALIHVLGSDLTVRERGGQGLVVALKGALQIARQGLENLQLQSGHEVSYDRYGFSPVRVMSLGAAAWVDGLLEVRDVPLAQIIEALRPYRGGVLRIDPAVAELRVSGMFRLDKTEQVLDTLARTLPIQVLRRTDYWVTVTSA